MTERLRDGGGGKPLLRDEDGARLGAVSDSGAMDGSPNEKATPPNDGGAGKLPLLNENGARSGEAVRAATRDHGDAGRDRPGLLQGQGRIPGRGGPGAADAHADPAKNPLTPDGAEWISDGEHTPQPDWVIEQRPRSGQKTVNGEDEEGASMVNKCSY